MEAWRDIPGYEGLYQVSDLGRVRSLDRISYVPPNDWQKDGFYRTRKGKLLSSSIDGSGYAFVTLCRERVKRSFKVHRLVAEAFVSNPHGKPQVNHIDGNKANNAASNLEWVTDRENIGHAYAIGIRKADPLTIPPTLREYEAGYR